MLRDVFTYAMVMLLAIFLWKDEATGTTKTSSHVEFSIAPGKNVIVPGEPSLITITLKNLEERELQLNLENYAIGTLRFDMQDIHGKNICQSSPIVLANLPLIQKEFTFLAGTEIQENVILNQWCSTILPAGQYKVICDFNIPDLEQQASTFLTIQEMDEKSSKQIFTELAANILDVKSRGKEARENAVWAYLMLMNTKSPLAIEPLLQIIQQSSSMHDKEKAMTRLQRIGTPDAIREIMRLAVNSMTTERQKKGDSEDSSTYWLRMYPIHLMRETCKDGGEPAIKDICESAPVREMREIEIDYTKIPRD